MVTKTGEAVLEELTQELERANQEILRLKGYAVSTGLASSATAEGKVVRLRGIAISEGTHNGKFNLIGQARLLITPPLFGLPWGTPRLKP